MPARRRRSTVEYGVPALVALIDVVFQLLAYFVVQPMFLAASENLPESDTSSPTERGVVVVRLDVPDRHRNGSHARLAEMTVWVDHQPSPVAADELADAIRAAVAEGTNKLRIECQPELAVGPLRELIHLASENGLSEYAIGVSRRSENRGADHVDPR